MCNAATAMGVVVKPALDVVGLRCQEMEMHFVVGNALTAVRVMDEPTLDDGGPCCQGL